SISILPSFFLQAYVAHRSLLSFPTRRSSDLRILVSAVEGKFPAAGIRFFHAGHPSTANLHVRVGGSIRSRGVDSHVGGIGFCRRSEEHTSELQSRFDLVCRLLLEKKKQQKLH